MKLELVILSILNYSTINIPREFAHLSISASLDVKKKLYGSVLVVGGGLSFPGAPLMLQQRLYSKLPPMFQRSSDAIEVCSNPKVCHNTPLKPYTWKFSWYVIFCAQSIDRRIKFHGKFLLQIMVSYKFSCTNFSADGSSAITTTKIPGK